MKRTENGNIILEMLPEFKGLQFMKPTYEHGTLSDAVHATKKHKTLLPSLAEALAFRIEVAAAQDASQEWLHDWEGLTGCQIYQNQLTRTAAIFSKCKGRTYVTFDDIPDVDQNILLAKTDEGVSLMERGNPWILPWFDRYIKGVRDRSRCANRSIEITNYDNGNKEARAELLNAATGSPQLTPLYAILLKKSGHGDLGSCVSFATYDSTDSQYHVCPVRLDALRSFSGERDDPSFYPGEINAGNASHKGNYREVRLAKTLS